MALAATVGLLLAASSCQEPASVTPAATTEVVEESHDDGTPKVAKTYQAGELKGQVEYYESGSKKLSGSLTSTGQREGKWEFWYKSGLINSVYHYKNGKRHGLCTVYYENGYKRFEGTFRNDKRVEMWYFWTQEGKVDVKIDYRNGEGTPKEYRMG